MEEKKPYVIAIIVQVIYSGMFIISKVAFDQGMNTFVFIFYRQAASSLLLLPVAVFRGRKNAPSISFKIILKLFLYAFIGNTFSLNLYNLSMKLTSATVASATLNSQPVITFCLALLFRMEVVRLRSFSGVAKVTGVLLCLAGVLVIALYSGPGINPINHHRVFASHALITPTRATWIKGAFLMVLANITWSFWIVKQAVVLEEYPDKMLMTLSQCVFSTMQSFIVAVVAERDFSKWKLRLDISLLAIIYTGFMVTAVSSYLQAWCVEMRGPVFLTAWTPTTKNRYFPIGHPSPNCSRQSTLNLEVLWRGAFGEEGSPYCIVGGILLVGGLYTMLWGKNKENKTLPCKVNIVGVGVQNEQEHQHTEQKKGSEEQNKVEQV